MRGIPMDEDRRDEMEDDHVHRDLDDGVVGVPSEREQERHHAEGEARNADTCKGRAGSLVCFLAAFLFRMGEADEQVRSMEASEERENMSASGIETHFLSKLTHPGTDDELFELRPGSLGQNLVDGVERGVRRISNEEEGAISEL